MPSDASELIVQTETHPRGWILVPIRVGRLLKFNFVLNTGFLVSAMSRGTRDTASAFGYLEHEGGRIYRLQELTLAGQLIPDLRVHLGPAAGILGVEGILGLNFLQQFGEIRFDVSSRRLTLRR